MMIWKVKLDIIGYNSVPYQSMMQRPDGENYYTGNVILRSIEEWLENN